MTNSEMIIAMERPRLTVKFYTSLEMLSNVATVAITVAVFMWWAVPLLLLVLWLALRPRRDIPSGSTSTPTPDAA